MKQRGRKGQIKALSPVVEHEPIPVRPPPNLSEAARAAFVELVAGCEPRHFEQSDVTLLARYAVATVLAEGAEATLQEHPDDTKALAVWEKSVRTMSGLALRLRLGPQSRRERAAKVERDLTWDERFRLEHHGQL
jgi:phage terminase small subunit